MFEVLDFKVGNYLFFVALVGISIISGMALLLIVKEDGEIRKIPTFFRVMYAAIVVIPSIVAWVTYYMIFAQDFLH